MPDWPGQVDREPEYATHRQERIAKHRINLEEAAKSVYEPPYRARHRARRIEKAEIRRMLQEGLIEPARSEWSSPVVLVPEKDRTLRFCVDYCRLNKFTRRDCYPIPRMDKCIDSLGNATVFNNLDCKVETAACLSIFGLCHRLVKDPSGTFIPYADHIKPFTGRGSSSKLPKCHFFQAFEEYLGQVIRLEKLEVSTSMCDAIKQPKPPGPKRELYPS